jgi:hypothetical protein
VCDEKIAIAKLMNTTLMTITAKTNIFPRVFMPESVPLNKELKQGSGRSVAFARAAQSSKCYASIV